MEHYWFIEEGFFAKYQAAVDLDHRPQISADQLANIRANADKWAGSGYANDNLRVVNGVAHIGIQGVLLESASFIDELYAKYLGESYSTYAGIEAQITAAENNNFVEKIQYHFDTPGGVMAGVDNTALRIATSTKPSEAVIGWMAASAGFYLASQADKIIASNPTSSVGSIGVVVDIVDATEAYKRFGIQRYSLTSTAAPRKRPEPHSEEFKDQIIGRLDDLHAIFAQRVSEGRTRATGKPVTPETVNAEFGQGGMVIASEALKIGMIDEVSNMSSKPNQEASMTEQERAEVDVQINAAMDKGVNQERARVAALLPWMGADQERVMTAIKDGTEMSSELVTELSTKASEKAVADAKVNVEAAEAARIKAAADARTADEAPVVTGEEEGTEKSESEKVVDGLYAATKKRNGGK